MEQMTGMDDGPELPAHVIRSWKKSRAIEMRRAGKTLREIGAALGVSHECVRIWTAGVTQRRET